MQLRALAAAAAVPEALSAPVPPSAGVRSARTALPAAACLALAFASNPPVAAAPPEPRRLTASGGRVSWYRGPSHELIAYDAVADEATGNTEVHLIQPDGGGARCLTCTVAAIPKGFVGQPAWHPDGEHLVLQVENRRSEHRHYNHPSWGVDNDLWLVRRDGGGARRIWATAAGHAALHPHFDGAGRLLVFAERVPTGRKLPPRLRRFGPGGENQWAGWRLHVAEVDVARGGEDVLSRHRVLAPNGPGFYETHGFTSDGRIVYSFTPGGEAYVDDGYSARLDGSDVRNLTQGPGTWEEHAQYSPDGKRLAFISSRPFPSLRFPGTRPRDLRTELLLRDGDGVARPITGMNARLGGAVVVSDFDWDASGQRLVFQVARLGDRVKPELWLLDLAIPPPSTPPPPSPPW